MAGNLYLIHYNRGEDICPKCYASIVWRCVGDHKYTPCDKRPVICYRDSRSGLRVVYKGEIVSGVKILNRNNSKSFMGKKTFYALQPHIFTCKGRPIC